MPPFRKLKLLIAEDDEKVSTLYRKYVSEDLFDVMYAADGETAIKAYEAIKPDIVMLDLVLPKKTGMAVLQHIRSGRGDMKTSIIVATARHREEIRKECQDLLIQGYLIKPFDLKSINASIMELHGMKGAELIAEIDQRDPDKPRLLIAEDDEKLVAIYRKFIPIELFKVRIEEDGQNALEAYHAWKPDIIVLDLVMPNKSGMDILEEIREKHEDFYTTIIVASGERKAEVVTLCAKFDIQGYLLKPLNVKSLAQTIHTCHKRHVADLAKKGWAHHGPGEA